MNFKAVLNTLGKILQIEAALMALPLIVALVYGDGVFPFIVTMVALFAVGGLLSVLTKGSTKIYAREGFLTVALSWILMSLFGALPFYISGQIPSFTDALFETVSGFTTTGASILTNTDVLSKSMIFWRAFTHWIGGMGVLVFMLAVIPMTNSRSVHLIRAETTGVVKGGKLVPKMRSTATILYGIYFGLTVLEIILLLCGKMSFFDAVVYSMSTAGTGGFASSSMGLMAYNTTYIYVVVSVFMLLFGVNFNIYYAMLLGNLKSFIKNEENRWYLGIVGVSTIAMTLNIMKSVGSFAQSLLQSFFNVSSIITTTGFTVWDFTQYPTLSQYIIVVLMLIGACAGSTGGAIKVSRILVLLKAAKRNLKKMLRPNQVEVIRLNGAPLDEAYVENTQNFFAIYMAIVALSAFLVSIDGKELITSLTAAITCVCNVGPGLAEIGPSGSFAIFSAPVKLLLSLDMLIGRLEIFPMIMFFVPAAWRRR